MKSHRPILFSTLILMLGILACSMASNPPATTTPIPTATPVPAATPIPVVLFEEREFKTQGCFSSDPTDEANFFTEGGALHVEILVPEWYTLLPCMDADVLFTDFIVEVDATQVDGADKNVYGIMLRVFGYELNYYIFGISGIGNYTLIYDHLDKDIPLTPIVDWKPSSAIKQGQATNHLKAVLIGNLIELYVNDSLIETVQDDRISTGSVGFFASSANEGGVHVSFDNLVVTEP